MKLKLNGYEIRARRVRHKHGGRLTEFVRQGFICKRLKKYELDYSECICSEFTILKKKWICFSIYRPPSAENNSDKDKLENFGDLFNLTNLVHSETCFVKTSKSIIDLSLNSMKLKLNGYEIRARRVRHKHGGRLTEFVRQGFICKRLKKYELDYSECICSEFTILKKKWICFSIYRPPSAENNSDKDKLENFGDLFNLTNLVHSETCFMKTSKSIIDLILRNKPLHFQKNTCF